MENKELVGKVLEKLAISLSRNVKSKIPRFCSDLKRSPAEEMSSLLESFRINLRLTDEQYAKVLEFVVDAKVFMGEDGKTRDDAKVKLLKSITDHPPVKVFFDRTY